MRFLVIVSAYKEEAVIGKCCSVNERARNCTVFARSEQRRQAVKLLLLSMQTAKVSDFMP